MPDICAVFGCSNRANSAEGISLHCIPFYGDERPEAKRRRKILVNFVARKRAQWTPNKYSAVCYVHFTDVDYEKYKVEIPGTKNYTPRLKKDDFGITAQPTIFLKDNEPKNPTSREKRRVKKMVKDLVSKSCSTQLIISSKKKSSLKRLQKNSRF
ncbi:THAP domain-containing protein 5-like [Xenia sp. Carnegie-2017]|uniref:THAP domain-containing protein 5-like n=1 Tax=Xenia sp. Carnegie-2017 TaxID=2897299 RepID=UPI001F04BF12|nr:THAP domain-containing protein 5-like [Xenia sp. Carnegie-2017]